MYQLKITDIMLALAMFLGWQVGGKGPWTALAATLLVSILVGLRVGLYVTKKRRKNGEAR